MRVRKKLGVCYVLMVLLTIAIVIPIIWLVFISMKPNSEIMNNPLSLPNALDFGNYVSALQTLDLFTLYKNTAFIAVCSLAVEIVITFSSAVGLTRLYYRSDRCAQRPGRIFAAGTCGQPVYPAVSDL